MLQRRVALNTALQCWNNVVTIWNNVAAMLQRRVALKISCNITFMENVNKEQRNFISLSELGYGP